MSVITQLCENKTPKRITILAMNKVFFDTNFYGIDKQIKLSIISPEWDIGNNVSVVLSGKKGRGHDNKAKDGSLGKDGDDGLEGNQGTNAGTFFGICSAYSNTNILKIVACGGEGGRGQHGGDGSLAREEEYVKIDNGKARAAHLTLSILTAGIYHLFSEYPEDTNHEIKGYKAGKYGLGGIGGRGGNGGQVLIIDFSNKKQYNIENSYGKQGKSGENGRGLVKSFQQNQKHHLNTIYKIPLEELSSSIDHFIQYVEENFHNKLKINFLNSFIQNLKKLNLNYKN